MMQVYNHISLRWTAIILLSFAILSNCSSTADSESNTGSESTNKEASERSVNAAGESGCIVGNCENGDGTYVWEDGSKYVGQWKDGKRHGNGTYLWAKGDKYAGEFANGDCQGNGIYTWKNGARYEGEWKDGKMHGTGTFTWPNGSQYTGKFENHSIPDAPNQETNNS